MKKITKAIIPAAGLGTRMLPISHAVPKEMLPIVDLPAVYYLVEEAARSGITDILIITNRDKDAMEDFFDLSIEYDTVLRAKGKTEEADKLREIANMAWIILLRMCTKGIGTVIRSIFRLRATSAGITRSPHHLIMSASIITCL